MINIKDGAFFLLFHAIKFNLQFNEQYSIGLY